MFVAEEILYSINLNWHDLKKNSISWQGYRRQGIEFPPSKSYSRVPNKRTGRLLENEKKIPPIRTYLELYLYQLSVKRPTYMFTKGQVIFQNTNRKI